MTNHEQLTQNIELSHTMPIIKSLGIDESIVSCKDKPDIRIDNYNGKNIGIEVIECHSLDILTDRKQQIKLGESRISKLQRKCRDKFVKAGLSIHIQIELNGLAYKEFYSKHFDDSIFDEIIGEVENRIKINKEYWELLEEEYDLNEVYNYKYVSNVDWVKHDFQCVSVGIIEGGGVNVIELDCVNHCIKNKNDKLQGYKLNNPDIDEFWLCIYVEELEFRDIDDFSGTIIPSDYDRIYLTTREKVKSIK